MRWPWQRREDQVKPDIEKACEDLKRLVAQRPEVDRIRGGLGKHRQMNGFADLVFRPGTGRKGDHK